MLGNSPFRTRGTPNSQGYPVNRIKNMRDKVVFLAWDVFDSNKGIEFYAKNSIPLNILFVTKCIFVNVSEYI